MEKRQRIPDSAYRAAAYRLYNREGEIEVDEDARVSRGASNGAYVQAWVWVYNADITPGDRRAARARPGARKAS